MSIKQLPVDFISSLNQSLGDEKELLMEAINGIPPVSIRLHPIKGMHLFQDQQSVKWETLGRYLTERPVFTLDPFFHAGCYYVQEASSMFVGFALKQCVNLNEPLTVLDLCAAPGGKTTQLLSLVSKESLVVSNEIISNRNKILRQNIAKWGYSNSIVTQNKSSDFRKCNILYDVIIVDAPCSGEGLFRKDAQSINEWNKENVAMCSIRQTEILDDIIHCLKPNGILLYSTCTYEFSENDFQIEQLISKYNFEKIDLSEIAEGITLTKFGYQFYPHKIKGEGFYLSALRNTALINQKNNNRFKQLPLIKKMESQIANFIEEPNLFDSMIIEDQLLLIPKHIVNAFLQLKDHLYIRHAGLNIGTIKGNDIIPSYELALSLSIKQEFPYIEVDINTALKFMKCETIKINYDFKGWGTVNYNGLRLGWIKVIPGRINNYFPKEMRILMDLK